MQLVQNKKRHLNFLLNFTLSSLYVLQYVKYIIIIYILILLDECLKNRINNQICNLGRIQNVHA